MKSTQAECDDVTSAELRARANDACERWRAVCARSEHIIIKPPIERRTTQEHLDAAVASVKQREQDDAEHATLKEALIALAAAEEAEGNEIAATCAIGNVRAALTDHIAEEARIEARLKEHRANSRQLVDSILDAETKFMAQRCARREPTAPQLSFTKNGVVVTNTVSLQNHLASLREHRSIPHHVSRLSGARLRETQMRAQRESELRAEESESAKRQARRAAGSAVVFHEPEGPTGKEIELAMANRAREARET